MLRLLDPETAHRLALRALRLGVPGVDRGVDDPRFAVSAFGLAFRNPIGLAAGFDKDAEALAPLAQLGFGFLEAGTVTPLPQVGNPRPRLFRLTRDAAVINRMGFNNSGADAFVARFAQPRPRFVPVGANIGINKEGAVPERDYPDLVARLARTADYVVLNVSSPNTPGLRDLQGEERLRSILRAVADNTPSHPPLLVKVAPDLAEKGLEAVVQVCVEGGVAGLIVSNTTLSRPDGLRSTNRRQPGGLSGTPLLTLSTRMLARAAVMARGRLTLIGVGGVATGEDVLTKLRAGASLVQVYTAFTYAGPALIRRLKDELRIALEARGFADVPAAIGTAVRELA